MYLLGIPDWLFWWGFVALMLALLLLAGNLCLSVLPSLVILTHILLMEMVEMMVLVVEMVAFLVGLRCPNACPPTSCWQPLPVSIAITLR